MTFCDLTSGRCGDEPALPAAATTLDPPTVAGGELLYVTDPICSACWAMEPAWRRLLFHYGDRFTVRYLYGGLLPGWQGFSDAQAGIARPADVAPHWDEVARRSGQPIDASVWLRDPLWSSYPPSIALHAVRLLAPDREAAFLRRLREGLFLEAHNIARPEVLAEYAAAAGVDPPQFAMLFHGGIAARAFRRDLEEVRRLGVRGFPTLIIHGRDGQTAAVHGAQPYARLEQVLLRLSGLPHAERAVTGHEALAAYGRGTTREFAELLGLDSAAAVEVLQANGAVRMPMAGDALWRVGSHPSSSAARPARRGERE